MTAHPIGATVRVRDDAQSRYAGETGTVTERLASPTEPRPVLVRFPDRTTALYADAELEAVPGREMLLDVEPGPPIDWRKAATSHMRHIRELASERDALRKELGYWKSVVEDPFLYWGQDDPPYALYGDDEDGDLDDAAPERPEVTV